MGLIQCVALALLASLIAACQAPTYEASIDARPQWDGREGPAVEAGIGVFSGPGSRFDTPSHEPSTALPATMSPFDRLLAKTAEMKIVVPREDEAVARCLVSLESCGGYLAVRGGSKLTCRVPVAAFDAFCAELRTAGSVIEDLVRVDDVTEQHRDLAIRLENSKRSRDRLLVLLEKAEKVEDLLKIEAEVRRLTDEIETMTAQLKDLDSKIAFSVVTVAFISAPSDLPRRRASRFSWINSVGAEHVLHRF